MGTRDWRSFYTDPLSSLHGAKWGRYGHGNDLLPRVLRHFLRITADGGKTPCCYIDKAAFQGEDMKIYPFFGPSAGTTECTGE